MIEFFGFSLFLAAVSLPLYVFYFSKPRPPPANDASPEASWVLGGLLVSAASWVLMVVGIGYLLPGLTLIPTNWLTEIQIRLPHGKGARLPHPPSAPLRTADTDMSLVISAIAFVMLCLGLLAIIRGIDIWRRNRSAAQSTTPPPN